MGSLTFLCIEPHTEPLHAGSQSAAVPSAQLLFPASGDRTCSLPPGTSSPPSLCALSSLLQGSLSFQQVVLFLSSVSV